MGPPQRDVSSYTKRSLLEMKNAGKLQVIVAAGLPSEMERLGSEIGHEAGEALPYLLKGWAKRFNGGRCTVLDI